MVSASGTDLFVGLDGGATKTHATVVGVDGATLGEARGPAASLRLSAERAWDIIRDVARRALPPMVHSMARLHLGIGVAGTELVNERNRLIVLIRGYNTVRVESDAHVACLGAHGLADGAIVVVGTGMIGYRIEQKTGTQVGGWGFPHDDNGSGAWLGLKAVRATLCAVDGRAEPTALTIALSRHFQENTAALVKWACAASAADFATLASYVVTHAEAGDVLALEILKSAGGEISRIAQTLIMNCSSDFPLSLAGGLATSLQNYVLDSLKRRLRQPKYSASKGAALMIRQDWLEKSVRGVPR